ncbi:MAG TPA: murein biosynthesis integral membrane protein MurJ [Epsilonproteobacteria bacterium]|nr:murein biosynthesis integral membrane protein MurJ [Campylobacterota bacterium]
MRLKAIFTNSFGILISRITGLIRDIFMAGALGASIYSDIFFVAFKLPNLFRRIFAEGAFTQSFMPSFVASRQKGVFAVAIFLRFLLFLILGSLLVTLFPEIITKLIAIGWDADTIAKAAPLTAINFWYLDLIFIVTFLATILQYKEHFATTAFSTVLLNISMIGALWMFLHDDPKTVALALSISVLIGGMLQVLVHIWALGRTKMATLLIGGWKYRKTRDTTHETKKFKKIFLPAIWGNSTPQINAFLDTALASFLVAGSISYLFYANRIFQLPLAIFAIATATALFPAISKAIKNNKIQDMQTNLAKAFWFLAFLLGISTVGGVVFGEAIIKVIFERGKFTDLHTVETTRVLMMYMIGLLPFGLAKLFSLVLYATHRQAKAAKIATYSLIANLIASLILMWPLGAAGLALAGSIGGWVLFAGTIKEIGYRDFLAILRHRYSIYWLALMVALIPIFKLVNNYLMAWLQ